MDRNQLIVMALQQRVAELELDKAVLRAEITILTNEKEESQINLSKEVND